MSHFKKFFFASLFYIVSTTGYCQVDSMEIDDDTDTTTQVVQLNKIGPHKRGVYKTYEEYINNTPSVEAEFTLTPLQISKNNPLIVEANVDYKGKRPKKIWGVSDGEYVYLRVMSGQFFKNHYFRLQCDGPVPYIYLVEKNVFMPTGLGLAVMATAAATSAALPPFVYVRLVRDKTNYSNPILTPTNARIRKYLKEYPDLLEAYNNEHKHNKATKAKYITDYNERKLADQK
jgi:hypothetical protein